MRWGRDMSINQILGTAALTLAAAVAPVTVQAAPMTFDCDTPTDRASAVTIPIGSSMRASGSLTAKAFRPGKSGSLGGFAVNSTDGKNAVGIQLMATADGSALNLILVTKDNGKIARRALFAVPTNTSLPFSVAVGADGKGSLTAGQATLPLQFAGLQSGNAQAFCSSGQFLFSNLDITGG